MGDTVWIKPGSLSGKKTKKTNKQTKQNKSNLLEYSEEYFIPKLNVTSVAHKKISVNNLYHSNIQAIRTINSLYIVWHFVNSKVPESAVKSTCLEDFFNEGFELLHLDF